MQQSNSERCEGANLVENELCRVWNGKNVLFKGSDI